MSDLHEFRKRAEMKYLFMQEYLMKRASANIGGLEAVSTLREAERAWDMLQIVLKEGKLR